MYVQLLVDCFGCQSRERWESNARSRRSIAASAWSATMRIPSKAVRNSIFPAQLMLQRSGTSFRWNPQVGGGLQLGRLYCLQTWAPFCTHIKLGFDIGRTLWLLHWIPGKGHLDHTSTWNGGFGSRMPGKGALTDATTKCSAYETKSSLSPGNRLSLGQFHGK